MPKRDSWVSLPLFKALVDDCQALDQWGEIPAPAVEAVLRRKPSLSSSTETGH